MFFVIATKLLLIQMVLGYSSHREREGFSREKNAVALNDVAASNLDECIFPATTTALVYVFVFALNKTKKKKNKNNLVVIQKWVCANCVA